MWNRHLKLQMVEKMKMDCGRQQRSAILPLLVIISTPLRTGKTSLYISLISLGRSHADIV